jgi:hypothetical protein
MFPVKPVQRFYRMAVKKCGCLEGGLLWLWLSSSADDYGCGYEDGYHDEEHGQYVG